MVRETSGTSSSMEMGESVRGSGRTRGSRELATRDERAEIENDEILRRCLRVLRGVKEKKGNEVIFFLNKCFR